MRTLHLFAITATLTFLVGCDKKDTDGYSGLICASDFGVCVPVISVQTVPLFTV